PIPCTVTPDVANPETFSLTFHQPQRSVTPGQWAVLYDDDTVLAAGIIA
ncbi:MAG: tRNA 2-thiouridine(34) synthase MnmA, partial [Candidatus Hydrogenedentes bacterium]|nr:tRNA 2-thiouridine(34) synthase MnmA [Candidatus Hydrogenedentota bacterium]